MMNKSIETDSKVNLGLTLMLQPTKFVGLSG